MRKQTLQNCIKLAAIVLASQFLPDAPIVSAQDSIAKFSLKKLIPKAAAIPNDEFRKILSSEIKLGLKDIETQSLSMLLVYLPSPLEGKSEDLKLDFDYVDEAVDPIKLIDTLWLSKSKGYATLIQPGFIKKLKSTTKNGTAKGTVAFEAKGFYSGKVDFTATRRNGAWAISEFRLPKSKLRIVLGKDSKWKIVSPNSEAK